MLSIKKYFPFKPNDKNINKYSNFKNKMIIPISIKNIVL